MQPFRSYSPQFLHTLESGNQGRGGDHDPL